MVICIVCGAFIEKYNILHFSESSSTVVIGIIAGIIFRLGFTEELIENAMFDKEFFSLVLLPIIIFESGYNMTAKALFLRYFGTIFVYAAIGSVFTAFAVGGFLILGFNLNMFDFKWSIIECITYGSIVSATDPVSVLALFSSLQVEPLLNTYVYGESVLNDAVAIVLFKSCSQFISKEITAGAVIWSICFFMIMIVGSTLIGIFSGIFASVILKYCKFENGVLDTLVVFLCSYMSYCISESLSLSGITSSVFCGLSMQYFATKSMCDESVNFSKDSCHIVAHMCEMLIFFQIGQNISLTFNTSNIPVLWILYVFVILLLVRFLMIIILSLLLNIKEKRVPYNYQVVMIHSGLRGAIAYSLSIIFPTHNVEMITLYIY